MVACNRFDKPGADVSCSFVELGGDQIDVQAWWEDTHSFLECEIIVRKFPVPLVNDRRQAGIDVFLNVCDTLLNVVVFTCARIGDVVVGAEFSIR